QCHFFSGLFRLLPTLIVLLGGGGIGGNLICGHSISGNSAYWPRGHALRSCFTRASGSDLTNCVLSMTAPSHLRHILKAYVRAFPNAGAASHASSNRKSVPKLTPGAIFRKT